jgi:hypothetical protein
MAVYISSPATPTGERREVTVRARIMLVTHARTTTPEGNGEKAYARVWGPARKLGCPECGARFNRNPDRQLLVQYVGARDEDGLFWANNSVCCEACSDRIGMEALA